MIKKRNDKESMICLTPKTSKVSLSKVYRGKEKKISKRAF